MSDDTAEKVMCRTRKKLFEEAMDLVRRIHLYNGRCHALDGSKHLRFRNRRIEPIEFIKDAQDSVWDEEAKIISEELRRENLENKDE